MKDFSYDQGEVKHSLKTPAKNKLFQLQVGNKKAFIPFSRCFMTVSSSNLGNNDCSCSWNMCQ